MGNWQNFFLQRMGNNNGIPYAVCESVATWGIWCKEIPFKIYDKVKSPSKHTWHDEHGDDEYIPSTGLYMEAYTMNVEFGCKLIGGTNNFGSASVDDVREKVGTFLNYLRTSGMLYMYSSHTRIGRQYVRMDSVGEKGKWTSENGEEWLIFDVTFKINDPVTDITL